MRNIVGGSFIGFVLAAAFVAACGGGGLVEPAANLDELTQQVAALQADVGALRTDLTTTQDEVLSQGSDLHVLQTEVAGHSTALAGLRPTSYKLHVSTETDDHQPAAGPPARSV